MLRNLSIKRKELRKEQSRVDNQFVRLMNDLQLSLQKDEDLTVIAADTFAGTDDLLPMPVEAEKKEEHEAARHSSQRENEENNDDDWRITKPSRLEITPQQVQRQSRPNLMCFAGEVFTGYSSELPDERREAMSPRSLGNTSPFSDNLPSLFPSASHPSPSALRAGAQAWRERHGQSPRSGIDFRTGMSGHMALLSTHAHPHEFLEPSTSYSTSSSLTIPRMSSHTGLTMSRNKAFSILSSLTLPTFGSSANTEERREDTVQQSGSM